MKDDYIFQLRPFEPGDERNKSKHQLKDFVSELYFGSFSQVTISRITHGV